MFIKLIWKSEIPPNELHLIANPDEKQAVKKLLSRIENEKIITLIDPRNDRHVKVPISQVETIETVSRISTVTLSGVSQSYLLKKRLKELDYLNQFNLYRINNSTMVNMSRVKSFQVIGNARLEITTDVKKYIVSRYYAKKIKEELSCSKN